MRFRLWSILILCLAGVCLPAQGAENVLNLTNSIIAPGSKGKVVVGLSNATECRGLQANIELPDGLSLTGVSSTERTSASMVNCNTTPGQEKLIIVSLGSSFSGNSGAICELELSADPSFAGGELRLTNVRMSDGGDRSISLQGASAKVLSSEPIIAGNNILSISNNSVSPGSTVEIPVNLSNSDICKGLQFDIELPDGLSLIEAKNTDRTASCMITSNVKRGQEKVIIVAMGDSFSGSDGAVCKLILQASSSFKGGNIQLADGRLSDGSDQSILLASASAYISCAGEMTVAIPDFEIVAGEKKSISIDLANSIDVSGIQFDLYLPDSIKVDFSTLSTTSRSNGFIINHLERDGYVRIMLYSSGNKRIINGSGSFLTLDVEAIPEFSGETSITLKNIRISDSHAVSINAPDVNTKVIVAKPKVQNISLSPGASTLKVGEQQQFIADVLPGNVSDKSLRWSIGDETIATTDENGLITAKGIGSTILTVISNDNPEVTASATITVVETPAASITLNHTEATLKATET
ncbi:MAG: Ig-like domain-containing protein, partial [Muribaculaceae bacterium]|nr:Ig-like domain-containing protein [Muribaculaceae bacterium]